MSKNPLVGIGLAVVLASAAISLALIEQKALAQAIAVDPCARLLAAFNAAKTRLISDIISNNLRELGTDLANLIIAANALAAAGCSVR
jgi:sugar phosphate permease